MNDSRCAVGSSIPQLFMFLAVRRHACTVQCAADGAYDLMPRRGQCSLGLGFPSEVGTRELGRVVARWVLVLWDSRSVGTENRGVVVVACALVVGG